MNSIHNTDSDDYYYCASSECVCHEVKRTTQWHELYADSSDTPSITRATSEKKSLTNI